MKLLEGKRAVVTGSSRGLGRAYVSALAAQGAKVVVNGTKAHPVQAVVDEVRAAGGEAVAAVESIASFDGAERVINTCIDAYGGIDILVNNAGAGADRMIFNITEEEIDRSLSVEFVGTLACSRHASRDMKTRSWGRIISTVDPGAMHGMVGHTCVGGAKGGIVAMTLTWAIELARWGITANGVIPRGFTEGHPAWYRRTIETAQQYGKGAFQNVPTYEELMARGPKPEEITPFLVYLCSEEADWINGQVFTMHKGKIALWSHPWEKVHLVDPQGFTVEEVRRRARETFEGLLEPVGPRVPWWTEPP